jgi:N-methylhydantoinase A
MTLETRLAIDIGGTFTDVVLETPVRRFTTKILTTPDAPESGVLKGIAILLAESAVPANAIELIIHGTTLATNALIERKGAKTALLVTDGFRDSIEIAYEHRFEQSDVFMERPPPLVPRDLRFDVPERMAADGSVLLPLDEGALRQLVPKLQEAAIEAVAIGFLHSYANADHEIRAGNIIQEAMPHATVTLSSKVCPEIREYDRLSTACANAYVQPLMAGYLQRLKDGLVEQGMTCPLLLMMSSGGVTTLETAIAYPIRLVESGPAGGAIFSRNVAAECDLSNVLSFDMGGTTAKICLIDNFEPQLSRSFEVARMYRFLKGSGIPIRIPVIDMVEIGAGGGSIARVNELQQINVGPDSAGAAPGPACYDQGGTEPTVTDADLTLGRIDVNLFAGGKVQLDQKKAEAALDRAIGNPLDLPTVGAAAGISEIVDENMANAARVHAIECGKDLGTRTLIAFGGAAPLHASRLAEKLGVNQIVIPTGAGVGSAIGFLRAPIAYEVVRTRFMPLSQFDNNTVNNLFIDMRSEALEVVRLGAPTGELREVRTAYMRYRGQGHEIDVDLPVREMEKSDFALLENQFVDVYGAHYGRTIPNLDVEVVSWSLALSTIEALPSPPQGKQTLRHAEPATERLVFDSETSEKRRIPVYMRSNLEPGSEISGPAIIAEDETSTLVSARFDAQINAHGYIVLTRKQPA